ncbi:MAG: glycosyl hydrolase [Rhodothermales bacterium]
MARLLSWVSVVCVLLVIPASAQTVEVGSGSYSTRLPSGAVGPQNVQGQTLSPKVSATFNQRVQSNDFWSSLIFPFSGLQHSNVLFAHPITAKATSAGLEIGYTDTPVFAAADYLFPFAPHLTVGVEGMNASRATTDHYGDWTVSAEWRSGSRSMVATIGHGLPFAFFRVAGGNARIQTSGAPTIWHNDSGVLGLTIAGVHYGIFAPSGSSWSGSGTLTSTLNDNDYLSVALLPDTDPATLTLFTQHAYAFVTDSRVTWEYDENRSEVVTTFHFDTEVMEGSESGTLSALYRHQWLATDAPLLDYRYASPRGSMALVRGTSFVTRHPFSGVLPALPDRGDYNPVQLRALVEAAAGESLAPSDTYNSGKRMARFANLVHIADQLGATSERDHFIEEIKFQLEDWLSAGGALEYSYNATWDVMTGYPSSFGADTQINDHHFHASYAIASAATIARYDSTWAAPDQWGSMINLLIRDANSWDRDDELFPFLRSHDAYAGHSWAAGHGDFGDGNNQESSSESMNFASAVILWGEATGQADIRDLGVYLHATETAAVEQYWFDVDDAVFPEDYPHVAIGMVWGGKGVHSTWFGADPEFIHGINILPVTSGSLYLGRHPDYVRRNYAEIVEERNGLPNVWKDVLWQYLAFGDADMALSQYLTDPSYEPFDGESKAHTMHWLYTLRRMGQVDTTITANIPTYGVFRDAAGERTYVAYNSAATSRNVVFSDGTQLEVGPRELVSYATAEVNPNAPVAILQADKTFGKVPLSVSFTGSNSFDRAGGNLSYEWTFGASGGSTESDPNHVFEETGTHRVHLTVRNDLGFTMSDSVDIAVFENGSPFGGTPASVPGRIQAENYDEGGEGRAYHDTESINIGLAYRPNEGVDIEAANDGGFAVYWIVAGEWIEYTFQVSETGVYDVAPSVATVPGFGKIRLLVDGEDISGWQPVRSTGSFQFWEAIDIAGVELEAGIHILRVEADSDSDKTGWLFSLNHIDVSRSNSVATEDTALPTQFGIQHVWPNPFHSSTTIAYAIESTGPARLEIFDTLGRRRIVLADGLHTAGRYQVTLDASSLVSGLYFARLTSAASVASKQMVRVK